MSYSQIMRIMQQRGISINKVQAVIIMGNGDRFERDVNAFINFWDAFPRLLAPRRDIWHWAERAWESGVQTKPKVLMVNDL
jgi:hypothetical protein